MKSSAWYSGLWRKKLNELPVKDGADSAWLEMHKLLDKHMPQSSGGSGVKKFMGAKVVSILFYVLPAAAMIGTVSYFSVHTTIPRQVKVKSEKADTYPLKSTSKQVTSLQPSPDLLKDSLEKALGTDSIAGKVALSKGATPGAMNSKPVQLDRRQQISGTNAGFNIKLNVKSNRKAEVSPVNSALAGHVKHPQLTLLSGQNNGNDVQTAGNPRPGTPIDSPLVQANLVTQKQDMRGPGVIPGNEQAVVTTNPMHNIVPAIKDDKSTTAKLQAGNKVLNKASKQYKPKLIKKLAVRKVKHGAANTATFNYGLEAGLNLAGGTKNLYIGATGTYAVNKRWLINSGLRLDLNRPISGEHTHRSFNPVDSSRFKIYDSRKIQTITLPVDVEYRLSKMVSIHAGPTFSYTLKQSNIINKLGTIINYRDTLSKSQSIDSAFKHSAINKFAVGVSAGVSLRMGRLYLDSRYLQNITPYKVNTGLGEYKKYYGSFQIGIRYQFK